MGDYMSVIQNDLKRSAKVYKDNCDTNGFARSCTQYGISLLLGKGWSQAKHFIQLNNIILFRCQGCEKDVGKSVEYFSRACELSDNEGCFYAGQLLTGNDPQYKDQVKTDVSKALIHLENGCKSEKNGIISGECCFYAHSLYLFGKNGAPKDLNKAFKLALRGCHFDHLQACNNLSQMYALGMGTETNKELADTYKRKTVDMIEQIRNYSHIETQRT